MKFFFAGVLVFLFAGCNDAPCSRPPSDEEVRAFKGRPIPPEVQQKMKARKTPRKSAPGVLPARR